MTITSPLQWPDGWPRTAAHERASGRQFKQRGDTTYSDGGHSLKPVTLDAAQAKLVDELDRLGAGNVVLSMSRPSNAATAREPGVALYFQLGKRPMAMACDRFDNRAANCRSLGLAIEAMRQLERHGGGAMMERAFTGFAAIAPPRSCWEILGVPLGAGAEDVRAAFKAKAMESGAGGNVDMGELVRARDEALQSAAA